MDSGVVFLPPRSATTTTTTNTSASGTTRSHSNPAAKEIAMMIYPQHSHKLMSIVQTAVARLLLGSSSLSVASSHIGTSYSPLDWTVTILSQDETQQCLQNTEWKFPNSQQEQSSQNTKNPLAVFLDADVMYQINSTRLNTECYTLSEARCIYCDEVHVTF